MLFYAQDKIKECFRTDTPLFEQLMAVSGEPFRHQKGRKTQRIRLGDSFYFIKQHKGVGWREIIKNLLQGRLPVLGAKNEWLAIQKLSSLNVPVPKLMAFGEKGLNPASLRSFVLMEEVAPAVSLEDLTAHWRIMPPPFSFKYKLIQEVARIARTLHLNGINHRDFYICHFLLAQNATQLTSPTLFLIDLHRATIRRLTPTRWIIKDLAGLYFSSKESGLTCRDLFRFMKAYRQKPLREIMQDDNSFWQKVKQRGDKLYHDHIK